MMRLLHTPPPPLLLLLLAVPGGARADAPSHPSTAGSPDSPDASYVFDDDQVHAARRVPQGEVLHVRPGGGRRSLVRVRRQFIRELLRSVEQL